MASTYSWSCKRFTNFLFPYQIHISGYKSLMDKDLILLTGVTKMDLSGMIFVKMT